MKASHEMGSNSALIFYVVLMIAIVIVVDFLFFRHRFRERLIANIAIVLAFLAFYLLFLKHK